MAARTGRQQGRSQRKQNQKKIEGKERLTNDRTRKSGENEGRGGRG